MSAASSLPRRVGVGHLSHESNSFSPLPTPLQAFDPAAVGVDAVTAATNVVPSLRGFRDASPSTWELIGLLAAEATPSGPIEGEAANALCATMRRELLRAGSLDGVLLYLHGAMLTEDGRSLDLALCQIVREVLGEDAPIVVVMDLHGNIPIELGELVQGVIAYHTNPHVDEYERAVDAARLLEQLLAARHRPHVAVAKPRVLLPTLHMLTSHGPMAELESAARAIERAPGILAVAVFGGWPLADARHAGPAVVVTALDQEVAAGRAQELAAELERRREGFAVKLAPLEEAARRRPRGPGPLVLADVADNPGGGGTSDTTDVLRHLVRARMRGAFGCIWDPGLVERVASHVGETVRVAIGGHLAPQHYGAPVSALATVAAITDGRFRAEGDVLDHGDVDCGRTALLDIDGLKVVVTSKRHPTNDRGFFRQVGINPEGEPLVVVKSRGHFRAEFEPIAGEIVEVDARGPTHPDLSRYTFTQVLRPVWPLDHDAP